MISNSPIFFFLRELLVDKKVSANSSWEKELSKIVFDPRYLLLTAVERKAAFEAHTRERAEEERVEKKKRAKEASPLLSCKNKHCNVNFEYIFDNRNVRHT